MSACWVEGCEAPAGLVGSAWGLCRRHYRHLCEWRRREGIRRPMQSEMVCSEAECLTPAKKRGMCDKHYSSWYDRHCNEDKQRLGRIRRNDRRLAQRVANMGRQRPDACELCGGTGSKHRGIVFDHDHVTGKPRGWLCDRCNRSLGLLNDDVSLLRKMVRYIENCGPDQVVTPFRRRA